MHPSQLSCDKILKNNNLNLCRFSENPRNNEANYSILCSVGKSESLVCTEMLGERKVLAVEVRFLHLLLLKTSN